jgi:Zn ribbon nucleic-acid-binding protein
MIEDEGRDIPKDVEALIKNGLDFLHKARQELESQDLKFSIVCFWTAVEIMLKVPLVHEHWTLVCTGKKIERKKYLTGDFQSVNYQEVCDRLRDVLEMPIPKNTADVFDKVRQHRNRVVHFYHRGFTEADQQQIRSEQADAWFALNRLIRDDWSQLFGGQLKRQLAFNETMLLRNHEFYASVKYRHESVQERLHKETQAGRTISLCNTCNQISVVTDSPLTEMPLFKKLCLVCHSASHFVEVVCPNCEAKSVIEDDNDDDFFCVQCSHKERRYDILEISDKSPQDMMLGPTPAGCSECEGLDTVCQFGEGYLCTTCLIYHDSLGMCDYCTYYSSSVPEVSSAFGCNFCEGHRDTWDDN